MAIISSVDIGSGKVTVTVDHDPTVVSTDVIKGSFLIEVSTGYFFIKADDGDTTNVNKVYGMDGKVYAGKNNVALDNVENLKVNLVAVIPPTASNDDTEGYSVGSRWIDLATDRSYICLDCPTAAAVWKETTTATITFSRGGSVLTPTGAVNIVVWRAPFAGTVTNVRSYRVGGTGATINARKNGTLNHLASALSLTSADTWMTGAAPQNTAYAAGDKMEIMLVSLTGSPTQIAIQVDMTRP